MEISFTWDYSNKNDWDKGTLSNTYVLCIKYHGEEKILSPKGGFPHSILKAKDILFITELRCET